MKRCVMCGKEATGRMAAHLLARPLDAADLMRAEPPGPEELLQQQRDGQHDFAICEGEGVWCRANFEALCYQPRMILLAAAEAGIRAPHHYRASDDLVTDLLRAVRKMARELAAPEGERAI